MENASNGPYKIVPTKMSGEFIGAIAETMPIMGYNDRSQFIRDAVYEKMSRAGVKIPREITVGNAVIRRPAPQKGKTGRASRPDLDDPKALQAAADLAAIVAGPPGSGGSPPPPKAASPTGSGSARADRNHPIDNRVSNAAKRVPKRQATAPGKPNISP